MSLLAFRNVTFAYPGRPPVLRDATFELRVGDRVSLSGPNGSGKTTLLHLAVGLLRPGAGTVEAFGRARRSEDDFHDVRCRVGLLFQDPEDQLFCPTVAEDVAFGPLNLGHNRTDVLAIVRRVLERLGLQGYEDRITHQLSGGEKRLVSLAAVLAMEPEVLLLDEPTCGLDEDVEERLTTILNALPQSLIVVSHESSFVRRITHRQALLHDGCISAGAILKVVSGGQPGVERGALDAALAVRLPCGGWCAHGRQAEGGRIPELYRLRESDATAPLVSARLNVRDADATIAFHHGSEEGETESVLAAARELGKPCLSVDLGTDDLLLASAIREWLVRHQQTHPGGSTKGEIPAQAIVNVTGPRVLAGAESLQQRVAAVIADVIRTMNPANALPASRGAAASGGLLPAAEPR